MNRRKFLVLGASGVAGAKYTDVTLRPYDGDEDMDEDDGSTVHTPSLKNADWVYHMRYREWLRECYGLLAEQGSATGVDFLDVTDLPGFHPSFFVDDSGGDYSSFRGTTEEERQEQREQRLYDPSSKIEQSQNYWLETKIFAGLRVLVKEGNRDIQPPQSDAPPREQEWRYTGDGIGVDPTLEDGFDIVIDTVFDYE